MSETIRKLEVGEHYASQQTVKLLEGMLAEARRGELTGFCGVAFQPGRVYEIRCSAGIPRLEAAGALLDTAIARLGYATKEDPE